MTTHWTWASATRISTFFSLATPLALALAACRHLAPGAPSVTLGYIRLGWSQPDELPTVEPLSQQFTHETGFHLKPIPVPENTLDQLDLSRKLLEGGSGPDVLGIDVIWPGVLQDQLSDLRPSLSAELSLLQPQLVSNYEVDGRLVAIPYQVQIGVLEYRTDLLHEYGYSCPPKTWDELEAMAARIQTGERAKGNKDFWGYVWQGAAAESLTCDALEWQVDECVGRIIEDDRTRHSTHPQEAAELIRFLVHAQIQSSQQPMPPNHTKAPELNDMPDIFNPEPPSDTPNQHRSGIVSRPSTVTGATYEQVARAYVAAVHSVLTGERDAPQAAADLESNSRKSPISAPALPNPTNDPAENGLS